MLSGQLALPYLSQIRPSGEAGHLLEGLTFQARKLGTSEMKCHVRDPWKLGPELSPQTPGADTH